MSDETSNKTNKSHLSKVSTVGHPAIKHTALDAGKIRKKYRNFWMRRGQQPPQDLLWGRKCGRPTKAVAQARKDAARDYDPCERWDEFTEQDRL